jgi:ABC-type branched-subunit amino acid transport system ATPase component
MASKFSRIRVLAARVVIDDQMLTEGEVRTVRTGSADQALSINPGCLLILDEPTADGESKPVSLTEDGVAQAKHDAEIAAVQAEVEARNAAQLAEVAAAPAVVIVGETAVEVPASTLTDEASTEAETDKPARWTALGGKDAKPAKTTKK